MKVLYVTNMFPVSDYKYYGIHVKEQIESLKQSCKISENTYFINGRKSKLNYLYSIFYANYLITRYRFDLVHVHFGISGLFLLFNPFVKVPIVITLHGSDVNTDSSIYQFIIRKILSKCRKAIVMNTEMRDRVCKYVASVEVIPCGIDLQLFKPSRKTPNTVLNIGFAGNPVRPEKNYALFAQVMQKLEQKGFQLDIFVFHNLSRSEVVSGLNLVDYVLLTSFNEGSPQLIKEALACNTPIVSVPVGDVPQLLTGLDHCRVTSTHSVEELYSSILDLQIRGVATPNKGRERVKALQLDAISVAKKIYNSYLLIIHP